MLTTFHLQLDSQTEIVNKELERYLRHYTNYLQDDWDEWLFLAEAAQNSAQSATTKISPFYISNKYKPRMPFDITKKQEALVVENPSQEAERQRIVKFAARVQKIY